MKQFMTKFNIVLFCLLLAVCFFLGVLAPRDSAAFEKENREPTPLPTLSRETVYSGIFAKRFESFLSDNMGLRSFFMDLSEKVDDLKGFKNRSGRIMLNAQDSTIDNQRRLWVRPDRVMEVYRKKEKIREAYIAALNLYAKTLPEDIRLFSMLVPTQVEFINWQTVSSSQKETIDFVYNHVNPRVIPVPVYDILKEHKDEYIYFRTDHHWTHYGSFYGYCAFAETAFSESPKMSDYELREWDGFLGYLYNQAKDDSLADHADTIGYFSKTENFSFTCKAIEDNKIVSYTTPLFHEPIDGKPPKYSLYLGGEHQFAEIKSQNQNGKTLLVIKDSYANPVIPYLTEHYETILVIDPRIYYGTISDLLKEYEINDVLVLNYVFATSFSDYVEKMIDIR